MSASCQRTASIRGLGVAIELVTREVEQHGEGGRRGVERGREVRLVDLEHRGSRRCGREECRRPTGREVGAVLVGRGAGPSAAAIIAVVVVLPFVPETKHTGRSASSVETRSGMTRNAT